MNTRNTFVALTALAGLYLAGCSVPKQARETAGVLSLYTAHVKIDTENYAASRLELNKARTANIDYLEQSAVKMENANALQLKIWQLSNNDERAKLCQGLTETTVLAAGQADAFSALRQKQSDAVANMKSAITVQSKQLDDTAKGLSTLAETPTWTDDAKFYFGFLSEVRAGITNLGSNSLSQLDVGKNAAAKKTAEMKAGEKPQAATP